MQPERPPEVEPVPLRRLVSRGGALVMLMTVLLGCVFFVHQSATHAQGVPGPVTQHTIQTQAQTAPISRLDTFALARVKSTVSPDIWHQWTDATGTRSNWEDLGGSNFGELAAVSPQPGILEVFAIDPTTRLLHYGTMFNGAWFGWTLFPGVTPDSGGVLIGGIKYGGVYTYTVSSWGQGHMDLFLNMFSDDGLVLLHTQATDNVWSGNWQVLEQHFPGDAMQAVSWGPGRVDLFTKDIDGDVIHKWSNNDEWFSGSEILGRVPAAYIGGSVVSWGVGQLTYFTLSDSNQLVDISFSNGRWSAWEMQDIPIRAFNISVSTWGPGTFEVYVGTTPEQTLLHKKYNNGWSDWEELSGPTTFVYDPGVIVWTPQIPPPPTPTPTTRPRPTPTPCRFPGKPVCATPISD